MVAPTISRRSSTERSRRSASWCITSLMRPDASDARTMPTIMSSKGGPYSSIASCSGRPLSTRSMMKSRITGWALPTAWRRTVLSALRSGRPASMAVASSRMMFASSVRLSCGRPVVLPVNARVSAPRSMPAGRASAGCCPRAPDFGAAFAALAGASASAMSSCIGSSPCACRRRIADARSGAAMVPVASAPPRSMDWCRKEGMGGGRADQASSMSCVARSTSSMVVRPAAALCMPSSRIDWKSWSTISRSSSVVRFLLIPSRRRALMRASS